MFHVAYWFPDGWLLYFWRKKRNEWAAKIPFPMLWKLRDGVGPANEQLVRARREVEGRVKGHINFLRCESHKDQLIRILEDDVSDT